MDCSPPGSSVHGDSPGKYTGVGCHALLQGIFLTQGSNPVLLHCRRILDRLSLQGSKELLNFLSRSRKLFVVTPALTSRESSTASSVPWLRGSRPPRLQAALLRKIQLICQFVMDDHERTHILVGQCFLRMKTVQAVLESSEICEL